MFTSVEEQQDRDVVSCEGHVTKSANDSNSVVPDVLCFHVDVDLAEIWTILLQTLVRKKGLVLQGRIQDLLRGGARMKR